MRILGIILLVAGLLLVVLAGQMKEAASGVSVWVGEDAQDILNGMSNTSPSGYMGRNEEGMEDADVLETVGWISVVSGGIVFIIGCIRKFGQSNEYNY